MMTQFIRPRFIGICYTLCVYFFLSFTPCIAQPVITLTDFSTGYSYPIGIFNCGDARLFIMERQGYIYTCNLNGVRNPARFLDIYDRVNHGGNERGLLGMAFHPNYAVNGYFYVTYVDTIGNKITSRFSVSPANPDVGDASSELVLLNVAQPFTNHKGGCMAFGKDGYLYIGMGDGGATGDSGNFAQDKTSMLGKMLRIDVNNTSGSLNYAIPSTNPYYGQPGKVQEIWARGLRNPWRWSFDRLTGDLWIADIGQELWEEVNFQSASAQGGANYGWRCYEGNHIYNDSDGTCPAPANLKFPIYEYGHGTDSGCSVTGGYVYRGGIYGELFGKYVFADYCLGLFRMIGKNGSGQWTATTLNRFDDNEIVSFGEDKNGELYVTYFNAGIIKKAGTTNCAPTAFIKGNNTVTRCPGYTYMMEAIYGKNVTYQWYRNNNLITGATSRTYTAFQSGVYKVRTSNLSGCTAMSATVTFSYSPSAIITASGPTTFCAGGSVTLNASSANGYSWQWKKNGTNITGANNAIYTATQAGTYKCLVTDANSCTKISNAISVTINCRSGDASIIMEVILRVVPNPAKDKISVIFNTAKNKHYVLSMYDILGNKVYNDEKIPSDGDEHESVIDIGAFDAGVYYVMLQSPAGSRYHKLVKQ